MRPLLLTGANGFVGKILTGRLQQAGFHVTALSGQSSPAQSTADDHLQCDIRDTEALASAVARVRPEYVVHLAAVSHVPTSFKNPLLTWQTNVMGSMNLLEAVKQHAPEAFVLFPSSSEVYGAAFKTADSVDENTPPQPLNPYAASKVAAETAFREYFRQGVKGVIARPFNHIGAQQSADFVTASFARQIALIEAGKQAPVLKVGNLDAIRDFLDVQDVCSAYLELLKLTDKPGHPACLNVASGHSRRIRDMLDQLLALSTAHIDVELDPERLRPSDIPVAVGNARLLRETTGWQPQIALQDTLRELLDYWRQQVLHSA
ncbi:GDP-4-dehydro-6-deoxy-D-mannose reductase [Pseudomonas asturiensis]|uniref:GDP-4-dehydro-6-deoxy-D-mannose reductase n=1 Tax=Pseudomonas asturiensis TaxID=1190415 RepID=A0A1M7Q7H5_9PSED|nr:GDP-mannose 4,6-dehydratase [Pseudomonas asturiensis]SHN26433.1 GDP-4-dehydro-6-deoxy-D-mannose reductase [Pseudomonas asturiensis]